MNSTVVKTEQIQACWADPVFFAENYVRVGADIPTAIFMDSGKVEFFDTMDDENIVVARYPRRYGKTTALHVYALQQALFGHKNVVIQSRVAARQVQFLSDIAVIHRNLPTWMQSSLRESPDLLDFSGGGKIRALGAKRLEGMSEPDILLVDEPQMPQQSWNAWKPEEIIARRTKGKIVFVGTFGKNDPIMGKMWSFGDESTGNNRWASLPSAEEEKNIRAVLDMSNPAYARGY